MAIFAALYLLSHCLRASVIAIGFPRFGFMPQINQNPAFFDLDSLIEPAMEDGLKPLI